ncbi:type VII secretion-associated serine protease mycosin [Actinoplanes palleronii]|uniref:Type VII secretion-associated serine protease n=1 Tax=Actinoplanes palleronii TaxID=113570 RepID=A0ABQ4B0Z8_9ACTN|nr:type VII secretion-associated serine protease mycosin [Actinoplanes palleronii]GIE64341.1 type VII secretion-associated serine protease [Actinoplanes palleronii]
MRLTVGTGPVARVAAAALAAAIVSVLSWPGVAHADTVADYQKWYFDALKITSAHKTSQGAGVVVAVVDSGVDATHPDLRGQVLSGHSTTSEGAADGRRDLDRDQGHGTAMAGVIAGRGGGSQHVLGIAPKAKILPVSVSERYDPRQVADGIRWAADHGADVINVSMGGTDSTDSQVSAIQYAQSKNVVVVAASGNTDEGFRTVPRPANIPGVIAVAGIEKSGNAWDGATTGPEVVLAAPSVQVISAAPGGLTSNGYRVGDGTSEASAIVSGVAALIRAKYPDLDAANVVNRLIRTADDRGASGRDAEYGFGVVDPVAALTADVPSVKANPLVGSTSAAAPAGPGATTGEEKGDSDPDVAFSVGDPKAAVLQGGLCLAVVVLIGWLLVARSRRNRRRAAALRSAYPPGYPSAPPGYPQGAPPQPGYYPPAQPGYPPQQPGYPPAQPGYPPQQPGYYPPTGYPPGAPGQAPPPGPNPGPDHR